MTEAELKAGLMAAMEVEVERLVKWEMRAKSVTFTQIEDEILARREAIGRQEGIPGLWIVVPNDQQAVIDGKAVPVLSPGQRSRIPESWLRNEHRARGKVEGNA